MSDQIIPVRSEQAEAHITLDPELKIIRGVDGVSPLASVTQTEDGATISITDINGTTTANILNGEDGRDGIDGKDGTDGEAATISVGTTTTGSPGTNASVTNSGTESAAVFDFTIPRGETGATGAPGKDGKDGSDGKDGKDGQNGQDGYSPIATVTKNGGTATITITDKNGTTTAAVSDGTNGTNGTNGQDGYSPTASVSQSGGTTTITITDKGGTTTASVTVPTNTSDLNNNSGFITATDYATNVTGGTVKITGAFGLGMSGSGEVKGTIVSAQDYPSMWNDAIVSKGTLENVLSTTVGNIETVLQTLNSGGGAQ